MFDEAITIAVILGLAATIVGVFVMFDIITKKLQKLEKLITKGKNDTADGNDSPSKTDSK